MVTVLAEELGKSDWISVVLGALGIAGTIIGCTFVLVQRITRVETKIETKHLTYDSLHEAHVNKQAMLESKHNSLDRQVATLQANDSARSTCAASPPQSQSERKPHWRG